MSAPFKNVYHLRKVSDSDSKACAFCYKPTTSVLITSDGSSDFFYTCATHLTDKAFATPVYDEQYLKAKREKEALDQEIKQLKLKWDEKNRYATWDNIVSRFSSKSTTDKDKDKSTDKDPKSDDKSDKSHEEKLKELDKQATNFDTILNKPPRTYQLNKDIYRIRVSKKVKPASQQSNPRITKSTITAKDLANLPTVPNKPL